MARFATARVRYAPNAFGSRRDVELGRHSHERFLHEILGQRPVAREHEREAQRAGRVRAVELVEQHLGAHVERRDGSNGRHTL